jgi:hypothetical protein
VDQSKPRTRPLYIQFAFRTQGEVAHAFVWTELEIGRWSGGLPIV